MEGRYYRIRKVNPVNYFTYLDYGARCGEIKLANKAPNKKNVIVTHNKGKMATVVTLINAILPLNQAKKANSYEKYASQNSKTLLKFDSESDAKKAMDIINKMVDDSIVESKILTNGSVVTQNGLNAIVDIVTNPDGSKSADNRQNYVSTGSTGGSTGAQPFPSGVNWIVIGAAVLVAVVAVVAIVKLRKKK